MRQIKLSPAQKNSLTEAMQGETAMRNQFLVIQAQLNSAANHRQAIFNMICEAHNIDQKTLDPKSRVNISKDGYMTIGEVNASDRIKNAVNKTINKSNGHAKVKADSKKH